MFNFKTRKYYKKCLAMQISNNKILNNRMLEFKEAFRHSMADADISAMLYKKEIKSLKSKNTKLTNEIKKLKGGK